MKSVRKPKADEAEKLHAGKTFKDIAETELFQKLTESFAGISDRVNEVIDRDLCKSLFTPKSYY